MEAAVETAAGESLRGRLRPKQSRGIATQPSAARDDWLALPSYRRTAEIGKETGNGALDPHGGSSILTPTDTRTTEGKALEESHTMSRAQLTRAFLWVAILGWGIGLGAKLFDLLVLAGAYTAAPPASLALMPYGPQFPMDPGGFFQPLSLVMVVGILGALISGWKTPAQYRVWLWLPVIMFLIIWILTPTVFWPMIRELYGAASGKIVSSDAELIHLARRWIVWDWFRVVLIAVGFVASVRAISIPYPRPSPSLRCAQGRLSH